MTKFELGQDVVIRNDSAHFHQAIDDKGYKITGTIISITIEEYKGPEDYIYKVCWNNKSDWYREKDLELIILKKTKRIKLEIYDKI